MDILTHTMTGIAVSTPFAAFSKRSIWKKGMIFFCGGLGGALPDVDAVTLWPEFDATLGKVLRLAHNGREIYFSNFWYSHHNFTHSLLGGLFFTLIIFSPLYMAIVPFSEKRGLLYFLREKSVYIMAFYFSFLSHLLGDLPTPGCMWNGIKMFWPMSTAVGGVGKIWWWNNYDLFMIISLCCFLNISLVILYHLLSRNMTSFIPGVILLCSFFAVLYQVNHRDFSFAYSGHTGRYYEYEKKSLEIQQNILGRKIFNIMEKFDKRVPFYF